MSEIYFAKSNGLNGIILCEHFNAKDFLVIYDFLEKNFIYEGDRYIVEGISVFPGMEVSIKNKGHVKEWRKILNAKVIIVSFVLFVMSLGVHFVMK